MAALQPFAVAALVLREVFAVAISNPIEQRSRRNALDAIEELGRYHLPPSAHDLAPHDALPWAPARRSQ
jgi:hypothetical protein